MDRVVLVTGGSRGIGAAVVRQLSARGCKVGCGYHTSGKKAEALASEYAGAVIPVHYVLGDSAAAETAVDSMLRQFGRLDAVVANAGVWAGGLLEEVAEDTWDTILGDNVRGVAQICRSALPALALGTDPSITIMSSAVGLMGHPGDTAYASAKAALIGFGRSLAKETARKGVRVNMVAPGFVDTDMTAQVPARSRDRISQATVLGRFGTCDEVARSVVFMSEDATYCTGSVLTVDGGWSL
jgi:3-oxoacyl-[acyl-carrier protein] reductase